jgi:hypothetical protein
MRNAFKFLMVALVAIMITGCSQGEVARANLEVAEQNFEVTRRVVFYNGITGQSFLTITGKLALIIDSDGDLVVTVKTDDGKFMKHYLGLSDNVTYFSEALSPNDVSNGQYRVIWAPSAIVPGIELR